MLSSPRHNKFGTCLMAVGQHLAAWRHAYMPAQARLGFAVYKELAQIAGAMSL
ncbi:hypothetical protein [Pseudomonas sp. BLCC-B112]|uniref:hypothetical protein n=1 Tax=Pseudomonas sp. BLCC-B112 TaxID=3025319 RepID=UPI00234CDE38|nr:hypothetical protein [Pseudomonas sp. BLCC-B112]MDC7816216.1 hypothetical protein [Pseudomonas sp. BLCC-B112]